MCIRDSSYPDAAGGFTGGDAGAVLTVDFPPELLAQFDSGQRHGLLSALAADPRCPLSARSGPAAFSWS